MSQIKFLKKSSIDIDKTDITITATDTTATNNGQSFVDYMRNRNNNSAWMTTGSNDAANTQLDIVTLDAVTLDRILIVGHNLKSFTIQYHNGSGFVDFSTVINETINTKTTNEFQFAKVSATQFRIIITGTQTVNDDKTIKQLIFTESIGQLEGYPEIKNPKYSLNKKQIKLLSGKSHIIRQRGFFSASLNVKNYNVTSDLDIIESLYFSSDGVLLWVNAGDSAQFSREHIGYRGEDIFLVKPVDEFTPEFYKSLYKSGIVLKMNLTEVTR